MVSVRRSCLSSSVGLFSSPTYVNAYLGFSTERNRSQNFAEAAEPIEPHAEGGAFI